MGTFAGDANYQAASAIGNNHDWHSHAESEPGACPTTIVYGFALGAGELNATGTELGTFAYTHLE